MIISQIVAASLNNVIGIDNGLPWHMPTDSAYFKEKTWGHCIVTGRRNYDAEGKALPGRMNIVLTRNKELILPDAMVVLTMNEAFGIARNMGEEELFIVGGEEIYRLTMPVTDRIYLTRIHVEIAGDTYYPEPDWKDWKEISRRECKKDEKNPYDYDFIVYDRL